MKKLVLSLSLLVSGFAHADKITTVFPDVNLNGATQHGQVIVSVVDSKAQTITVSVYRDICNSLVPKSPDQISCMAMPELKTEIVVRLVSVKQDGCGSTIYTGEYGDNFVDGFHKQVEIVDNSTRLCEDVIAGLYELSASRVGGFMGESTHYKALSNLRNQVTEMIQIKKIENTLDLTTVIGEEFPLQQSL